MSLLLSIWIGYFHNIEPEFAVIDCNRNQALAESEQRLKLFDSILDLTNIILYTGHIVEYIINLLYLVRFSW